MLGRNQKGQARSDERLFSRNLYLTYNEVEWSEVYDVAPPGFEGATTRIVCRPCISIFYYSELGKFICSIYNNYII